MLHLPEILVTLNEARGGLVHLYTVVVMSVCLSGRVVFMVDREGGGVVVVVTSV